MDENKHSSQSQTGRENQKASAAQGTQKPESKPGAPGAQEQRVVSRRIFAKRWLYPAIYLGAAALIIGLMYLKSQTGSSPTASNGVDTAGQSSQTTASETFKWPVAAGTQFKVSMGFFPVKGTAAQQAKTLVYYDNGYYPHKGIDIQATDGKQFNVTAALSGKVTAVTDNPLMGQTVEVTSLNGYVERYESLSSTDVKLGEMVQQGSIIGTSGTDSFEPNQGNHLYFEVLKADQPVDPQSVLPSN